MTMERDLRDGMSLRADGSRSRSAAAPLSRQQQPIELKLAYFVGDQHAMSQWLIKWSEQLGKGFRRPHRGQALPGLADGAGAAAL